ncbi:MAG: hypothetical protein ACTH8J_13860, partial [Specibacter sp.]
MEKELCNWAAVWNEKSTPFICTQIAKEISALLGRLLIRSNGAGPWLYNWFGLQLSCSAAHVWVADEVVGEGF